MIDLVDTYGVIDGPNKSDSNLKEMLIFNRNDMIQNSGIVTELTIHFSQLPSFTSLNENNSLKIFLYIILPIPTENSEEFIIVNKYEVSVKNIIPNDNIQRFPINKPIVYLESGEYLAVGFGINSGRPFHVHGDDSYYIDLNRANAALYTYQPIVFIKQPTVRVTFSFKISSSSCLLIREKKNVKINYFFFLNSFYPRVTSLVCSC